jgi:histidine triad (HIT) family protein
MDDCIFCKIISKEIPKEFTYEDEDVVVFPDIHPIKPVHLLIVPKKHVSEFVVIEDHSLFEKVFSVVKKMIKDNNLENKGHRIVINGGGAQVIGHLHIHLISPVGKEDLRI